MVVKCYYYRIKRNKIIKWHHNKYLPWETINRHKKNWHEFCKRKNIYTISVLCCSLMDYNFGMPQHCSYFLTDTSTDEKLGYQKFGCHTGAHYQQTRIITQPSISCILPNLQTRTLASHCSVFEKLLSPRDTWVFIYYTMYSCQGWNGWDFYLAVILKAVTAGFNLLNSQRGYINIFLRNRPWNSPYCLL